MRCRDRGCAQTMALLMCRELAGWQDFHRDRIEKVPRSRPQIHDMTANRIASTPARLHLRRELEAHLTELGYSSVRVMGDELPVPEIVRISPVRGRIAYGETVLHADLDRKACHERLLFFSRRRTRHRSSILFFIGVGEADQQKLEALLARLEIRSG